MTNRAELAYELRVKEERVSYWEQNRDLLFDRVFDDREAILYEELET